MSTEAQRARDREWKRMDRQRNPEKYRLIDLKKYQKRRATHPDKENARAKRWYDSHPYKQAWLIWRNNRARAKSRGMPYGDTTKYDIARLILLPCTYCGESPSSGVDHIIALSRGGSNELDNLTPACWPCNQKKFVS